MHLRGEEKEPLRHPLGWQTWSPVATADRMSVKATASVVDATMMSYESSEAEIVDTKRKRE